MPQPLSGKFVTMHLMCFDYYFVILDVNVTLTVTVVFVILDVNVTLTVTVVYCNFRCQCYFNCNWCLS